MEDANQNRSNWKPRPAADPMDPVEVGNRALFISKEKSERITSKVGKSIIHPVIMKI